MLGSLHTKTTRPRTSTNEKTIKATERRHEVKCAKVAGSLMAEGKFQEADPYLQASLKSAAAKTLFPETRAEIGADEDLLLLVKNCKNTINQSGRY